MPRSSRAPGGLPAMCAATHASSAQPHAGTCLAGDTRILRADTGGEIEVQKLVHDGVVDIPVWSLDDTRQLVIQRLTHAFRTARSPVLQLTTESGKFVHLTETHMLLTPQGWEPMMNLASGAVVATTLSLPDPELMARQDPADLDARIGDSLDGECSGVPDVVGSATKEQLAGTLTQLWHGFGSVRCGEDGDLLYIDSPSRSVSQTICRVLSRFAVHADIGTWNGGLTIRDPACMRRFLTDVLKPQDLSQRAALLLQQVADDPRSCPGSDGALRWERVESIELRGIEEVYDVSVPGTHVVLGNGFALHRCQMRM